MIRTLLAAAGLVAVAWQSATAPAAALEVVKAVTVAAPPEKVWEAIGNFCGIGDWHPAVADCQATVTDGRPTRTLTLKDGGVIKEAELSRSEERMSYAYTILESPLPVSGYTSTLAVTPGGAGSRITWFGVFEAKGADDAKAQEIIAGIYEAGLAGIAKKAKP